MQNTETTEKWILLIGDLFHPSRLLYFFRKHINNLKPFLMQTLINLCVCHCQSILYIVLKLDNFVIILFLFHYLLPESGFCLKAHIHCKCTLSCKMGRAVIKLTDDCEKYCQQIWWNSSDRYVYLNIISTRFFKNYLFIDILLIWSLITLFQLFEKYI